MPIEHLNPPGMRVPLTFTNVVIATGGRTVFVAGQVGADEANESVPDDFEEQARAAFRNVAIALRAAGADFAHVTRLRTYVVGYDIEKRDALRRVRKEFIVGPPPAATLIGVQALANPAYRVEVEVTAVVDP